jgi:signal transduction histidine kinase
MVRNSGLVSAVGAPIMIDERLWGVAIATSGAAPLRADAEIRIANFADLIATAISSAKARTELAASRARIVAAGDETRKRLERDLHDGIQQRLVSLALRVRATQKQSPTSGELEEELSFIADDLLAALDAIREISRGIHPAILSEAGLGPALKVLARRSPIPIALDLNLETRLDEPLEAAAYYVASEALTNAAKHADASVIELRVRHIDGVLELVIRDDGVGGADPARGSGIIGLVDRVEALGGAISILSPAGDGTVVRVQLPAEPTVAPAQGGGLEEPVALRRSAGE